MPMYLITTEDNEDGMWLGEVRGFESEDQARRAAALTPPPPPNSCYVLYRCNEIETLQSSNELAPARCAAQAQKVLPK